MADSLVQRLVSGALIAALRAIVDADAADRQVWRTREPGGTASLGAPTFPPLGGATLCRVIAAATVDPIARSCVIMGPMASPIASRLAPIALTLAVACGASSPTAVHAPWRPLAPDATARDVFALPLAADGPPEIALVLPGTSRWGDLTAWFAFKGWGLYQGDRVLLSAGGIHFLPGGQPALASVPAEQPAVVRVRVDPTSPYQWFQALTGFERLDGTAAAPLDLPATLDDARRRWDAYRDAEAPALTAALDRAGADTPGQPLGPEVAIDVELFLPGWQAHELVVIAARHLARSSELRVPGRWGCDKYSSPGGGQAPPCAPHEIGGSVTSRGYAADLALILTYDAHGTLIDERRFGADAVPSPAPRASPL